jgi:hypothetical protein
MASRDVRVAALQLHTLRAASFRAPLKHALLPFTRAELEAEAARQSDIGASRGDFGQFVARTTSELNLKLHPC